MPRLIDRLPAFVPPDASAGEDATDQRGTVHFMFHYGAVYPTITWLAKGGATVNFLTSDVYRRIPGISPWIEKIYIEINSNLSRHVNGGDVILTNQNIRNLYRKLLAGEDVVILVDRTVANGPSVTVDLPGPCRCPWLAAPGR
ncbi:MAG: hypothetical protein P4M00_16450 [Azospirillaceae bacterium]|nr:hypothetical protein [Azospirillaceae bacterium]